MAALVDIEKILGFFKKKKTGPPTPKLGGGEKKKKEAATKWLADNEAHLEKLLQANYLTLNANCI